MKKNYKVFIIFLAIILCLISCLNRNNKNVNNEILAPAGFLLSSNINSKTADEINVAKAFGGSDGIKDQVIFYTNRAGVSQGSVKEKTWTKLTGKTIIVPKKTRLTFAINATSSLTGGESGIIKFGTYISGTSKKIVYDGSTKEKTFGLNSIIKTGSAKNQGIVSLASVIKSSSSKSASDKSKIFAQAYKHKDLLKASTKTKIDEIIKKIKTAVEGDGVSGFTVNFPSNFGNIIGKGATANDDKFFSDGAYLKPVVTIDEIPGNAIGIKVKLENAKFKAFNIEHFNLTGSTTPTATILYDVITGASTGISLYAKKQDEKTVTFTFIPGTAPNHTATISANASMSIWVKQSGILTLSKDGTSYVNATESLFTDSSGTAETRKTIILTSLPTTTTIYSISSRPDSTYNKVWGPYTR